MKRQQQLDRHDYMHEKTTATRHDHMHERTTLHCTQGVLPCFRARAGVLNQGDSPPAGGMEGLQGGMEGQEKVILNMSNTSIFFNFKYFVASHIQPFNAYCIIYGTYRNLSYYN